MELSNLYKTLKWHESSRDKQPGESVGLFITLPSEIAEQYPSEGKEGEDSSPAHLTLLYIGDVPMHFEDKILEVVQQVCENFKKFKVKIKSPKKWINDENQTIYHSPIASSKLTNLHNMLEKSFELNQIPFSRKYPEFKPHVTIEYVNEGEKPKFKDVKPEGEFVVESVWVWGLTEPYMFLLK